MTSHFNPEDESEESVGFPLASELLELGVDFGMRRIYLVGEINTQTFSRFMVNFHTMELTKGPFQIVLNSNGGEEGAGNAIFDLIRSAQNDICILGIGNVASIAALILQAAPHRLLTPECRFMIHNGSVDLDEKMHSAALSTLSREMEADNARYHRTLSERSGLAIATIKEYCERETAFDADTTVTLGFADGVALYNGEILSREDLDPRHANKKD